MNQEKQYSSRHHNVIMESRKDLAVSGVTDIESFDEQTAILSTDMGQLTIKGSQLHLERLSTDSGDVTITGTIYGLMYTDTQTKGGFFSRVFR